MSFRIVSERGVGADTKVYDTETGEALKYVTSLELKITPRRMIEGKMGIIKPEVDVVVEKENMEIVEEDVVGCIATVGIPLKPPGEGVKRFKFSGYVDMKDGDCEIAKFTELIGLEMLNALDRLEDVFLRDLEKGTIPSASDTVKTKREIVGVNGEGENRAKFEMMWSNWLSFWRKAGGKVNFKGAEKSDSA